jgi:hypothetical protein
MNEETLAVFRIAAAEAKVVQDKLLVLQDALLEECGPPTDKRAEHRLAQARTLLNKAGYCYSIGELRRLRNAAWARR